MQSDSWKELSIRLKCGYFKGFDISSICDRVGILSNKYNMSRKSIYLYNMSRKGSYFWMFVLLSLVYVMARFVGVTLIPAKVARQYVKHLQDLEMLNERQAPLISNGGYFNRYLSPEEMSRVTRCEKKAAADRKSCMKWLWQKKNIWVLHHEYLKENDTVLIEVGGHLGKDAGAYAALYPSRHLILEPVTHFANILRGKFKNESRVSVLNFGLGKKTETLNVDVKGVTTSIYSKNPGNTTISVINSTEFFTNIGIGIFSVDLLTTNCEGCEYDVIENLLESNMIKYFKNIQFQPHGHITKLESQDWNKRYCMIQEYMSRTHRLTYQCKHVWENWRRLDL